MLDVFVKFGVFYSGFMTSPIFTVVKDFLLVSLFSASLQLQFGTAGPFRVWFYAYAAQPLPKAPW